MGDAGRRHLAYQPALDGVRALAVAAVVVFHGGVAAVCRRVPRRRRVLRALRLPDHLAAAGRAGRRPAGSTWSRSGAAGPAGCCRRCCSCWSPSSRSRAGCCRRTELAALRRDALAARRVRRQLADGRPRAATTSPRPVRRRRCSTPGRSASRSSSTWSGRCSCSARSGSGRCCAAACRCWRARRSVRASRCSSCACVAGAVASAVLAATLFRPRRRRPGLLRHRHPGGGAAGRLRARGAARRPAAGASGGRHPRARRARRRRRRWSPAWPVGLRGRRRAVAVPGRADRRPRSPSRR